MKKIILFLVLIIVIAGFFYFLIKEKSYSEKFVNYSDDQKIIKVFNEQEDLIFQYSFSEFLDWAKENWSLFEVAPEVGGRKVDPENFWFFDKNASFSPSFDKLVFSVHDYAVASYASFIIILDIKTKQISLVQDYSSGFIEGIIWSDDGKYIAYTLATGRSWGDYLVVDNIIEKKQEFILSSKDFLIEENFLPEFDNLKWKNKTLYFSVNLPNTGLTQSKIRADGSKLNY